MEFQRILCKKDAGVATLQLNRPRALNAINETAIEEIQGAFLLASADPEVKALLLPGAEGSGFSRVLRYFGPLQGESPSVFRCW